MCMYIFAWIIRKIRDMYDFYVKVNVLSILVMIFYAFGKGFAYLLISNCSYLVMYIQNSDAQFLLRVSAI